MKAARTTAPCFVGGDAADCPEAGAESVERTIAPETVPTVVRKSLRLHPLHPQPVSVVGRFMAWSSQWGEGWEGDGVEEW